jgi:hypothetical protein
MFAARNPPPNPPPRKPPPPKPLPRKPPPPKPLAASAGSGMTSKALIAAPATHANILVRMYHSLLFMTARGRCCTLRVAGETFFDADQYCSATKFLSFSVA